MEIIKKTRLGQGLLAMLRVYHSESYRQWFHDFSQSHTFFKFQEYGPLNDDKLLYVINDMNASTGFFYGWCQVCRGLMVTERYGFTPVVDWTNGPYYDENGWQGHSNPFEYFFEPVSEISLQDAMQSHNVTFYNRHTDGEPFALYGFRTDQELMRFAAVNEKYIHIRKDLYCQILEEIHLLVGEKKTIAVHVRGVEWGNVHGHPIPVSLEIYTKIIDEALKEHSFEQIFLATDSEDTVDFLKKRYGNKIVLYNDMMRAKKGSRILTIYDESISKENRGYLRGYEVLKDMLTISFCDGIIAGLSYVSFAAEVFKCERGERYEYKDYVQMQLNNNGISPEKLQMLSKGADGWRRKKRNH